jgi:hypothetical protein
MQVQITGGWLYNNTAEMGGGLHIDGNATANISSCMLMSNIARKQGGGVHAAGNASATFLNSKVVSNLAQTGAGAFASGVAKLTYVSNVSSNNASASGGGLCAAADAQIFMDGSSVMWNTAAVHGGGVAVGGQAGIAAFENSSIKLNRAKWGAGMSLGAGQPFNPYYMKHSFAHNQGMYAPDLSPAAAQLSILGSSVVLGFVSQLASDQSVLPVRLNVSGPFGLPCDGQLVPALLNDDQVLGVNRSDSSGVVLMRLNIRRPPGDFTVTFALLPSEDQMPALPLQPANISLQVRSCIVGEVTPMPDACQACPEGSFSLQPNSSSCRDCPHGAQCPGGFAIVPLPGMWHSAPESTQVHR